MRAHERIGLILILAKLQLVHIRDDVQNKAHTVGGDSEAPLPVRLDVGEPLQEPLGTFWIDMNPLIAV